MHNLVNILVIMDGDTESFVCLMGRDDAGKLYSLLREHPRVSRIVARTIVGAILDPETGYCLKNA
jgi:hypothetical protein